MLTEEIVEAVKENSNVSRIIRDTLSDHEKRAREMKRLFLAYKGDVPIKKRIMPDPSKINETLANDFRGLIVDEAVGYLFGKPITYTLDHRAYKDERTYKENHELLRHFCIRNNIEDLDADTGKYAAICGYAGRLLYVDRNGEERACLVPPWECLWIQNETTGSVQLAFRYFDILIQEGDQKVSRTKVEVYDRENVTVYLQDGKGNYDLIEGPVPHLFERVPLIGFENNTELLGDFEKVEALIDAYDKTVSDAQNEIEEFRLAYLLLTGAEIDEDTLIKARATGVIELPAEGDAKYLTKVLQTEFIENQKDTLERNIFRFARAVDMADEDFSGGAMSGESRKWKLLSLENRAVTKERKFTKALREQFRTLATAWNKKGYSIDPEDIEFQFHRTLPVDLLYQTQIVSGLAGHVSKRTILEQVDFITDVEQELRRIEEENAAYIDLDRVEE